VLLDAAVNRMELAMPPKVTTEMAKGFTLQLLKAVLNGRGDEILSSSPARTSNADASSKRRRFPHRRKHDLIAAKISL
jgi:hypothetical protein